MNIETCFVKFTFVIFLAIISITDIRSGMIYNKILLPMAVIALIFDLFGWLIALEESMIAALVGGGILYIILILSHDGLGGGDVKFSFVLGLWLGIYGILEALFLSTIFALIFGIIVFIKQRTSKIAIPFGPFLSLGALMVFLSNCAVIPLVLTMGI